MKESIDCDFNINRFILAIFLVSGKDDATHKNRASHGLALHKAGDKTYIFSESFLYTNSTKLRFINL